jgi:hypothetical protein
VEPAAVELQLTLADLPANLDQVPSMAQSTDVAFDLERLGGLGLTAASDAVFPKNHWMRLALGAPVAYGIGFLVPTAGWTHEEWHRVVLSAHGIPSINPYDNPANWLDDLGSVSGMSDADLSTFKADDPAGFVYLQSAGFDATAALDTRIEDALFFGTGGQQVGPLYFSQSPMLGFLLNHRVSTLLYHALCASEDTDELVLDAYAAEADEYERDFTGPDCTGWVTDMLDPFAAYEERGYLDDGSIARYQSWSDLSGDERALVENTVIFDLVALADPQLFGIDGFGAGDTRVMAAVEHGLRPWGRSVDVRAKLRTSGFGGWVVLKNGIAGAGWMPGLELGMRPVPVGGPFELDGDIELWLQPEDQFFHADERQFGGAAEAGLRWWPTTHIGARLGVEGKTAGYRRGNPNLDVDLNGKLALLARW